MSTYLVYYSITSDESAEFGEYEETGVIGCSFKLSEALDWLQSTRTNACDGVVGTAGEYHPHGGRLTLYVENGMEFETGAYEGRSLHVHGITRASAGRIAALAGITLN